MSKRRNIADPHASQAFTLIEMMVVIVIILILSGIILRVATLAGGKGAASRAEAQLQQLANALSAYYAEYGRYPPGEGDPVRNTQYEYEAADTQTPYFRDTWLPQHKDPNDPAEFFPDIIPDQSVRTGWPYDGIPKAHRGWGLGYHYGLVAHLWLREQEAGRQLHWYDEDNTRDIAAKRRWAVMLDGIGPTVGWSALYTHPPYKWYNRVAGISDPWDRGYRYVCKPPYLAYQLWSAGPDGSDGTPDDIHVRD